MVGLVVIIFLIVLGVGEQLDAQCPMCRMSAESNLKAGGTAGRGLNNGILYMLAMPYLLVATMGYLWYRNRNKNFSDDDAGNEIHRPITLPNGPEHLN